MMVDNYLDDAVGHVDLVGLADEELCGTGIVGSGLAGVDAEVFAEAGDCRVFVYVLSVRRHSFFF